MISVGSSGVYGGDEGADREAHGAGVIGHRWGRVTWRMRTCHVKRPLLLHSV